MHENVECEMRNAEKGVGLCVVHSPFRIGDSTLIFAMPGTTWADRAVRRDCDGERNRLSAPTRRPRRRDEVER